MLLLPNLQAVLRSGMKRGCGFAVLCYCLLLAFAAPAHSQAEWTWMDEDGYVNSGGSYGVLGQPSTVTVPGSRQGGATWIDKSGNLWLFGGDGFDGSYPTPNEGNENDLWEFNLTTLEWTWVGGSKICMKPGVYGTMGTPAPANIPGARSSGSSWADSSGNFWLFGGLGYDSDGTYGSLNDLWEFDPTTLEWTWMGGSNTISVMGDGNYGMYGTYGTLGTPASGNQPGSRYNANTWIDGNGNLWLYGGFGYDQSWNGGWLNDLWEYNFATNQWTWQGGPTSMSCPWACSGPGAYGSLGIPASGNIPAGREGATSWNDSRGNFWLFGGYSPDNTDYKNVMNNELWVLNSSSKEWTWMGGAGAGGSNFNQAGVYGTLGTPGAGNTPGARWLASGWSDSSGNLWLFGGDGFDTFGNRDDLNDLWVFNPVTLEWAWMDGDKSTTNCQPNGCGQPGIYGTMGTPAQGNLIGGRYGASTWYLSNGDFWVFSGWGAGPYGPIGDLGDMWLFQPSVPPTATPTFSLPTGDYTSTQTVTLSDTNALAAIYYTTDGTVPTTGSTLYYEPTIRTKPITVSSTETIQAIAVAPGDLSSTVASATYTILTTQTITFGPIAAQTVGTPLTLAATANSGLPVSYTSTTPAVCTVSGSTATFLAAGTCSITASQAGNATYAAATPVTQSFTVNGTEQVITFGSIATQTVGTPLTLAATASSGLPVSFTSTTTSVCTVSGATATFVASGTCTIDANQTGNSTYAAAPTVAQSFNVVALPATATPTFTLPAGTYTSTEQTGISDTTASAVIYYTTDGSTPTASSTKYNGPVAISASETLKAIAVAPGSSSSAVASATYTLNMTASVPVISPSGGTYTTEQTVTLSDSTGGAAIYYTTNGATPTTSSMLYSGPITISATEAIKAIAAAKGYSNSAVVSATYTINLPAAATPTFSVLAGTYATSQTVTLSDTTSNTTIYYTTNGTTPTTSSAVYANAITVSATETLQAIAAANGYNNSAVATATYTINPGAFACHIIYTITPQNTTAFGATITIENTGTAAIGSWTLTWTFANGQEITQLWNGNETQAGAKVTVTNPSYNTGIPAGTSYTGMGFNGAWNGTTNTAPTSFAVNGTTCK